MTEKETADEMQFEKRHRLYSALSSWLFAIAGATNIGVLSVVAGGILSTVKEDKPLFKSDDPKIAPFFGNKRYNRWGIGMIAFGGVCMYFSNLLETKKTVLEWRLGGNKLARKMSQSQVASDNLPKKSDELPKKFDELPENATQKDGQEKEIDSPSSKQWVNSVKSHPLMAMAR